MIIYNTNINKRPIRTGFECFLRRDTKQSSVGHIAERALKEFFVDKLFLRAAGVDFVSGLTEYYIEDTLIKQAMLGSAKQVVLVADSSKFNRVALTTIASLDIVNTVVTDNSVDDVSVRKLENTGIEVMIA